METKHTYKFERMVDFMMNYNYLEAMTEDIKDYIRNDAELDTNDLL